MAFDWYKMAKEHGANMEAIKGLQGAKAAAEKELAYLRRELSGLRESRAYIRGGWMMLSTVATIAGAVGAILSRALWH